MPDSVVARAHTLDVAVARWALVHPAERDEGGICFLAYVVGEDGPEIVEFAAAVRVALPVR